MKLFQHKYLIIGFLIIALMLVTPLATKAQQNSNNAEQLQNLVQELQARLVILLQERIAALQAQINRLLGQSNPFNNTGDQQETSNDNDQDKSTITVTAPRYGTIWRPDFSQAVQWSTNSISASNGMKIVLDKLSNGRYDIFKTLASNTPNDGSQFVSLTSVPNGQYRITISTTVDGLEVAGFSDSFRVASDAQATITIMSPQSGIAWTANTTQVVSWSTTVIPTSNSMAIVLESANGMTDVLAGNTPNDGSHSVSVPNVSNGRYRISVSTTYEGLPYKAFSDYFTVSSQNEPVITITNPRSGAHWPNDASHSATWSTTAIPDSNFMDIVLQLSNGSYYKTLSSSTPNDGSQTIDLSNVPVGQYKIKINTVVNGVPTVSVSDIFTIETQTQATITVTAPRSGQTWQSDFSQASTWYTRGIETSNAMTITLKQSNGNNYGLLVSNTPNDGSQFVNLSGVPNGQYKLEITTTLNGQTITGLSDLFNVVSQTQPIITVTTPRSGQTWQSDFSQAVTWTTTDVPNGNTVNIDLYQDSGSFYKTLVVNTLNDGSQFVNLAGVPTGRYYIYVVTMVDGQSVVDNGDTFSVAGQEQATITVTTPRSGQTWKSDFSQATAWSTSGIDSSKGLMVDLYYSNGGFYKTLASNTPNDGSQFLNLAGVANGQYYIQISTTVDGQRIVDNSDVFTVVAPNAPTITVTTPRSGQTWQSDFSQAMTWTTTDVPTNNGMNAVLKRSDGSTYATLLNGTPNDGSQFVNLNNVPAGRYLIELSTTVDGRSVVDGSDYFTID